ncbi:MAG: type III pantothenate kinase [Bacteroidia bacterium]|nr:type III pantothenate kinase [Bacteroidia bacterium]MDW8235784.1 type III pantothenate kinase [Bacteroidia bacterium]
MEPALVVDIGNSRVKAALFDESGKYKAFIAQRPEELPISKLTNIIFIDTRGEALWREYLLHRGAEELTSAKPLPLETFYSKELGADRAAQLVAVWYQRQFPAIIVSMGTAWVIDILDKRGIHLGGVILAGAHLRLKALHTHTGKLPLYPLPSLSPPLIGICTQEALQAGAFWGTLLEIQGWLGWLTASLPQATLWVTGGESALLLPYLPVQTIFAPELTLQGAWQWWNYLRGYFP